MSDIKTDQNTIDRSIIQAEKNNSITAVQNEADINEYEQIL